MFDGPLHESKKTLRDPITIRNATPEDEVAVAGIAASVQHLHFVGRPDLFREASLQELRAWFRETLLRAESQVVVAEVDGVAAGYAIVVDGHREENAFARSRRWREIEQVGVMPSYQRRGVARALIENAVGSAQADGVPTVELNTWAFNQEARDAFQRLGFAERSVRYELPVLAQDIVTRPGHVADAKVVQALLRSCLEGMRRSGIDQWDERYPTAQVMADDLAAGSMLVAERAGHVIGAAALNDKQEIEYQSVAWDFAEGRIGVVHRLMIEPSLQRTGLGKAVMGAVEGWARRQGFNALRLDAFSGNPGALRLYRSLGYREAGTVRFRKGPFLCFEKRLDAGLAGPA